MLDNDCKQFGVGAMKRVGVSAILVAIISAAWPSGPVAAQSASPGIQLAQDTPAPRRYYRPQPRLRVTPYNYEDQDVYPYYYPGPDAVRVCNAHYVQEYRPSGTVIVPRVSCHWTRG